MDHARLARVLIDFSKALVTDYSVVDILDQLCDRVADVLPVRGAGVMLEDEAGDLRFVSASDETVNRIEALQIELGEGPCLYAYETGQQVIVPDLAESNAFPKFAPRALAAGMRAVYSYPMRVADVRIGALNVYCDEPAMFTADDMEGGQILADVATTSILNSRAFDDANRLAEQLQSALQSRVVIEQAKGRVAEQLGVDVREAFEIIRTHARHEGRRLQDLAEQIVRGSLRVEPDTRAFTSV